jgi:hypothetical protein
MLKYAAARTLIEQWLAKTGADLEGVLALREDQTIWKPYGWIFFYTSTSSLRGSSASAVSRRTA